MQLSLNDIPHIYIPTRGRVEHQATWDALPAHLTGGGYVTLVCPSSEVEEHVRRGRVALARPVNGIAKVRQWITEQADTDHILMLDDDLTFFIRKDPSAYNLRPTNPLDLLNLFDRMGRYLKEGWPMVGLSPRQMNNAHFPDTEIYDTRMNAVNCFNREIMKKIGVKFDDVDIMEDYHVVLSFLRNGYGNICIVDHAWDQVGVSGAAGGCSLYRTPKLQEAGAHTLHEYHPEFVSVVQKTPKGGWGQGMTTRTDVRVSWKKAAKHGASRYPAHRHPMKREV